MPPVDPNSTNNGIYRVRLRWLQSGQQMYNVFHFKSAGVQPIIANLLQVLFECAVTNLLPVLADSIQLVGADVQNMPGTGALEAEYTPVAVAEGGDASAGLPTFNAVVVNLRSLTGGRTGRGRMFLPGIPTAHVDTDQYDDPFDVALTAFLDCLATAFFIGDPPAALQFRMGVWSKKDNALHEVASYKKQRLIASMRSRRVGHGN